MIYFCLQILYFTHFCNSLILWNSRDNNRVHKSLQLGSVLYLICFCMINFNFPSCWFLHLSLNLTNGMNDVFLINRLLHLITLKVLPQQCKLWSSLSCTFLQSFVTDLTSRASFPNVPSIHIPRPHSLRQPTVTVTSHGRVTELVSVFVHAIGWGSKWPTSRVICLSKQSRIET